VADTLVIPPAASLTRSAAEATAVAGLIAFWNDTISPGVWCALFLGSALALNVFGVKFFGEGEFWFSIFKVGLVFMLFFFTCKSSQACR